MFDMREEKMDQERETKNTVLEELGRQYIKLSETVRKQFADLFGLGPDASLDDVIRAMKKETKDIQNKTRAAEAELEQLKANLGVNDV